MRPVAQIEIKAKTSDWVPTIMYIDSGADVSLLPRNFGLLLGLDLTKNIGEIRGIGEAVVPLSLQKVEMKLGVEKISAQVAIALINEVPYILGRLDVFKLFRISFQEYENKVVLEKPMKLKH